MVVKTVQKPFGTCFGYGKSQAFRVSFSELHGVDAEATKVARLHEPIS
jgi:hypothetical protein